MGLLKFFTVKNDNADTITKSNANNDYANINSPFAEQVKLLGEQLGKIEGYLIPGYGPLEIERFKKRIKPSWSLEDIQKEYESLVNYFKEECNLTANMIQRVEESDNSLTKDLIINGYLLRLKQHLGFNIANKERIDELVTVARQVETPQEDIDEFIKMAKKCSSSEMIDTYFYNILPALEPNISHSDAPVTITQIENTDLLANDKEISVEADGEEKMPVTYTSESLGIEYVEDLEKLGYGPLAIKKFKNLIKNADLEEIKKEYNVFLAHLNQQKDIFEKVLVKIKNGELSKNKQRLAFLLNIPQDTFKAKMAKLEKNLLILQYKEEIGYKIDYKRKFTIFSTILKLMGYSEQAIQDFVAKVSLVVKKARDEHKSVEEMAADVDATFRDEIKRIESRAELYFLYYEDNYNKIKHDNTDDVAQIKELKQLLNDIVYMIGLPEPALQNYYKEKDKAMIEKLWQEELKKGLYYTASEKERAYKLIEKKYANSFENTLNALNNKGNPLNKTSFGDSSFGLN